MTPVERARSRIGVPWVHQGRNERCGLDCVGLLLYAFEREDNTVYGRNPHAGQLEARMTAHLGEPLQGDWEAQEGDVVAMAYAGDIRHVGITGLVDGTLTLIHTDSGLGRVTEHPLDTKWRNRVRMVWRVAQ